MVISISDVCRRTGSSESVVAFHSGRFETVPVRGVWIVVIHIENRGSGFRIVIKTDEVMIIIDIP